MKIHGGGYLDSAALRDLGVASVGENTLVHEHTMLVGLENIRIGSNTRIDPWTGLIAGEDGSIAIGDYVHIGMHCYLAGTTSIVMEDFSGLSQGTKIYSATDDYSGGSLTNPTVPEEFCHTTRAPVRLGRHVIIGSGGVILPGVDLADGCSVGALALVTESTEPWGIYAGVPARRVQDRKQDLLEFERRLLGT